MMMFIKCLMIFLIKTYNINNELKRRDGGRVSTEQIAWMDALARQGYKTALCHGWDAAREEIQRYLGGKWA